MSPENVLIVRKPPRRCAWLGWQRIERIHRAAKPVLDIAVRLRGVHGREELLAHPSERPGLSLEAGICKVPFHHTATNGSWLT